MLSAAGVDHIALPADVDERAVERELGDVPPDDVAGALALAKALAVAKDNPGALVLGGDSLVTCDGKRFDKPADRLEAARHLRAFSGRTMQLHSAVALVRDGGVLWQDDAVALLHVHRLSPEFIDSYLDAEWPAVRHCVGVFRIEGRGARLFSAIEGDHFTVLGMPLLKVLGALRELGELAG